MKQRIETEMLNLLRQRGPDKTICPSEVARSLFAPSEWRAHMAQVREVAFRLVEAGLIDVTQRGRVVDTHRAKGPIRLRLKP